MLSDYSKGYRSIYKLTIHVVFVTKYRRKAISVEILSRLDLSSKYFYNKPYFWTGAYFVSSCGGVTVEQLKAYVEVQDAPSK
jgi:REP element-mobilizing transposase RayT